MCPIVEVSCVVSRENVFFNLQESVKPASMDFNLEDDSLWKPFLNERITNELFEKGNITSIQGPIPVQFYPELHNLQP